MDNELTGQLVQGAQQFLRKEMTAETLRSAPNANADAALALIRDIVEMGWPLLLLPEERGGVGGGLPQVVALFREVGRHLCPAPLQDMLVMPILTAGATSVDDISVLAAAWDDAAERVQWDPWREAVDVVDGKLSGTRTMVAHADCADVFVVTGRDQQGPLLGLVAASDASLRRMESVDVCARPFTVEFDSVPVEVLVRGEEARERWQEALEVLRIATAAEVAGICSRVTEFAVEYAKTRHQFGVPIGSFQAIKHMLADLWVSTYSLDALVETAATGRVQLYGGAVGAKAHSARTGRLAAETALQVLGGIGFTDEHPLGLYFKRALTLEGAWGDGDELDREVGRSLLVGSTNAAT